MKWPLKIILPGLLLAMASAQESTFKMQELLALEQHIQGLSKQRKSDLDILKSVKYFMINGNLLRAQKELLKLNVLNAQMKLIQDRYLAILFSLQNQWQKAWKILGQDQFQTTAYYPKICLLKILARIALKKNAGLQEELQRCSRSHRDHGETNFIWPRAMARVITSPNYDVPNFFSLSHSPGDRFSPFFRPQRPPMSDIRQTTLWLKLILFLGKEKTAFKQIKNISAEAYRHKRIREMLGLLYHRLGKQQQALDFVEDLDLANAHNIKGNIALQGQQYQIAQRHFQLALQKKQDSLNAIQRLLPLSWLNKDFAAGLQAIKLAQDLGLAPRGGISFRSALLTELGQYTQAIQSLLLLPSKDQQLQPEIMNELLAFNYLMTGDSSQALVAAHQACLKFDGLNCYLLTLLTQWQNFPKTLQKKQAITDPHGIDLQQLSTSTQQASPFAREDIFIDQKDIEHLDSLEQQHQFSEFF